MAVEILAADFYASVQGAVAARLLRERLGKVWPNLAGNEILGIGYTAPYLRLWRDEVARCVSLVPPQVGISRWPPGAPNLACVAEDDALPFSDLCFDRVLLVHGLENAHHARKLLREVWRVLRDDGRLLIVAPNRRGWWAHVETTPFGQGQPYSPGQIDRLLAASLFRVERRESALYVPPTRYRPILRSASWFERLGHAVAPRLAGVTLTEACKDVFAALPVVARPAGVLTRRLLTASSS